MLTQFNNFYIVRNCSPVYKYDNPWKPEPS